MAEPEVEAPEAPPAARPSVVFAAYMDRLASNGTVTRDVAGIVKLAIENDKAKLDALSV